MRYIYKVITNLLFVLIFIMIIMIIKLPKDYENVKNKYLDRYFPSKEYSNLLNDFIQNKSWNIDNNEYIKEINLARYSAYTKRLGIYMGRSTPSNNIQKKTYLALLKNGNILDGNMKIVGNTNDIRPIIYNSQINKLENEYIKTGAIDSPKLVHSPNNPVFSGKFASENNPIFTRWRISEFIQVMSESIAYGFDNVHDVVKSWINEDQNIETNKNNILGHRIHVLSTDIKQNIGSISSSKKNGWIFQSGIKYDSNTKIISNCDFLNLDKKNFTYTEKNNNSIIEFFPVQKNIIKFNPNICKHAVIVANYQNDEKNKLKNGDIIDINKKNIIFTIIPKKGYKFRSDNNQSYSIKIKI